MPPHDTCEYHTDFVKDIAILKENTNYIRNKICKHVDEGEKEGGFRDRLLIVERKIDEIERNMKWRMIGASLIGALVGNCIPDVLRILISWLK